MTKLDIGTRLWLHPGAANSAKRAEDSHNLLEIPLPGRCPLAMSPLASLDSLYRGDTLARHLVRSVQHASVAPKYARAAEHGVTRGHENTGSGLAFCLLRLKISEKAGLVQSPIIA